MPTTDGPKRTRAKGRQADRLSRSAILRAALAELDENGFASFSLRNLARRLGVYPTAIYWYVPNREMLLAGALACALEDVAPPNGLDWEEFVRQLFVNFREAIRRHPNVAELIGGSLMINISLDLDFVERTLAALTRAGFSGPKLAGAYNSVMASLVGFAAQEFSPTPEGGDPGWSEGMRERLRNLRPNDYPLLSGNLEHLCNQAFFLRWQNGTKAPFDRSYDMFIETLIAGLKAQLRN